MGWAGADDKWTGGPLCEVGMAVRESHRHAKLKRTIDHKSPGQQSQTSVSYTHLTLPTILLV